MRTYRPPPERRLNGSGGTIYAGGHGDDERLRRHFNELAWRRNISVPVTVSRVRVIYTRYGCVDTRSWRSQFGEMLF
jgi:hypothetical protein